MVALDDDNGHEYLMIAVTSRRILIFCHKNGKYEFIQWSYSFLLKIEVGAFAETDVGTI